MEVAGAVVDAADAAQNLIRLEEQLDQERSESCDLRREIDDLRWARDEALSQVSDCQARNLRVIEGLMDDMAKADVLLKQVAPCVAEATCCGCACTPPLR